MAESVLTSEFTFTDEQRHLRSAVRSFCTENFDERDVRQLMESDRGVDPAVWSRLGSELGVLGLGVSMDTGGAGGSLVDQAVAVEEFGACLACGPLFGTVYLSIPALAACPSSATRDSLLTSLVDGGQTAAFAVTDRAGAFDADYVAVTAGAGSDCALNGTVERVVDAGGADYLVVAARGPDGVGLYAVDASASGVERNPLVTLDLTRPQATVRFRGADARRVAGPDETPRVIAHALQVGSALLAAEQVGASQHLLNLAVEYAKTRMQFGRHIGSFQAVKHRLADMLVDLEHARSTAYHAVWALAEESPGSALAVSIAQATCSAAFSRIAADTIQVHGGIGFTWEHQAHLYFKRAATDAVLLGSAEQHRSRVAELVLDTASAAPQPVPVADGTAR